VNNPVNAKNLSKTLYATAVVNKGLGNNFVQQIWKFWPMGESTCDQEVVSYKFEKQGLEEGALSDRQAVGTWTTDEQHAQVREEQELERWTLRVKVFLHM